MPPGILQYGRISWQFLGIFNGKLHVFEALCLLIRKIFRINTEVSAYFPWGPPGILQYGRISWQFPWIFTGNCMVSKRIAYEYGRFSVLIRKILRSSHGSPPGNYAIRKDFSVFSHVHGACERQMYAPRCLCWPSATRFARFARRSAGMPPPAKRRRLTWAQPIEAVRA